MPQLVKVLTIHIYEKIQLKIKFDLGDIFLQNPGNICVYTTFVAPKILYEWTFFVKIQWKQVFDTNTNTNAL